MSSPTTAHAGIYSAQAKPAIDYNYVLITIARTLEGDSPGSYDIMLLTPDTRNNTDAPPPPKITWLRNPHGAIPATSTLRIPVDAARALAACLSQAFALAAAGAEQEEMQTGMRPEELQAFRERWQEHSAGSLTQPHVIASVETQERDFLISVINRMMTIIDNYSNNSNNSNAKNST